MDDLQIVEEDAIFLKKMNHNSQLKIALITTFVLRLFYSGLGALSAPYLKLDQALIRSNDYTDQIMTRDAGWAYKLLGVWERFDTLWYLHIARHGYDRPESIVFYPLYPILIRMCSYLFDRPLSGALLISTVASFFLFWGFQKLLAIDMPVETVQRAMLIYAVWPASFTLFAGYPDSLMTASIIWAIYAARRGRWWASGVLGVFAGVSKAAGSLVIIPLAVIAWREGKWRASPAALCLLAPLLFTLYITLAGHPPISEVYRRFWKTEIAFPLSTLWLSLSAKDLLVSINLLMLLLIFTPALVKKIRPEYTLYSLAALILFLMKKTDPLLQSTSRYVLAVFPAFASVSIILKSRLVLPLVLALLLGLNLLLLFAFFEWALVV